MNKQPNINILSRYDITSIISNSAVKDFDNSQLDFWDGKNAQPFLEKF